MLWPARALAANDNELIGRELSPSGAQGENIEGVLFELLGVDKRPQLEKVTVSHADPGLLRLQLHLREFDNYRLVATLLDDQEQQILHFESVNQAISASAEPTDIEFKLPADADEGLSFDSAFVHVVAQKFGRDVPGSEWLYRLDKHWSKAIAPENVVIRINAAPVGAAARLPSRPPGGGRLILPAPKVIKAEVLQPKYTIKKATLSSTALSQLNSARLMSASAAKPGTTTNNTRSSNARSPAKTSNTTAMRINPEALRSATKTQLQPQLLSQQQVKILSNTDRVLKQLPSRQTANLKLGIKTEDKNRGAQGPSAQSIDLLSVVNTDLDVPVQSILQVRKEIYLDKNPQSGVLYYIPRAYHLQWDTDEGYGMKMLYAATEQDAESGQVLMAMRLASGVSARDSQLVMDLARAYRAAHNTSLKINVIRPLPLISEHPGISLSDSLGSHFNIAEDSIVASVVSDALEEMNVSWVTDEVTKENIQLVLSQDIGIAGDVTYDLESDEVARVSIPASVRLADQGTFGPLHWRRNTSWRNPTPYPLRLKYLHMMLLENNTPVIYSWDLGRSEVPPRAQVEWDTSRVPRWLDQRAKRAWVEYAVVQDCVECDREVMRGLTFGASRASSRQDIILRTLTPLADSGAIEIGIRLRSRYFSSAGDTLETQAMIVLDADREEFDGGKVYLIDRQPGEERPGDPLFEYQLELVMSDGSILNSPAGQWIPSHRGRLMIGKVQLEQAVGPLPPAGDE